MTKTEIISIQEKQILKKLKDFQLSTVKQVDKLFWEKQQQRVLVSDEVGLGKTLVAKGVIVEYAKHFFSKPANSKLNVVYVCSNASISSQNVSKLSIGNCCYIENTNRSRLSLQHKNISQLRKEEKEDKELRKKFIHIIPITPGTSLKLTKGSGLMEERELIYVALSQTKFFNTEKKKEKLSSFLQRGAYSSWSYDELERYKDFIRDSCEDNYLDLLKGYAENILKRQVPFSFLEKEDIETEKSYTFLNAIKEERVSIINYLRYEFVNISLDLLHPDLVIMDEFQRFKDLLIAAKQDVDETQLTEQQLVARKFFKENQVLLLSATPYKMYSTLEEIDAFDVDQHYSEFFNVIEFLKEQDQDEIQKFKTIWADYSKELKILSLDNKTSFIQIKQKAENSLSRNICRTERISVINQIDLIKRVAPDLHISKNDVLEYIQAQKVLNILNELDNSNKSFPTDFVKSCPFLLSYMKNYKFKTSLEDKKNSIAKRGKLKEINQPLLWLEKNFIDDYSDIHKYNARLDSLLDIAFKLNAAKLLWVTPSMPYYKLGGDYIGTESFSKVLIFSAWEMVPRMVSSLVSYEAERIIFKELESLIKRKTIKYFLNDENNDDYDEEEESDEKRKKKSKKRRYPSSLLNFALSKEKVKPLSMVLFVFMYPSQFLKKIYNPLDYLGKERKEIENDLIKKIENEVNKKIPKDKRGNTAGEKYSWYYLLPLLLDDEDYVNKWFEKEISLSVFNSYSKYGQSKGFSSHLKKLRELYNSTLYGDYSVLGRIEDENDLYRTLADIAIASPGICIDRTYSRYSKKQDYDNAYPSQIAKLFIDKMNTPESTAVVMTSKSARDSQKEEAHWKNLLSYCVDGNLQAMFDEYAHILVSGLDESDDLIETLHTTLGESFTIKTTPYLVDTFENFCGNSKDKIFLRSHFAVSFTKGENGREEDIDRKTTVRNAFNSPFRPFVLASTSIGQEGLDFHNYCRKIVHWNLPNNPIDLEQREGRINRYKCLAIRQNIAKRYSGKIQPKRNEDIWDKLFDKAKEIEKGSNSDLIPYWGVIKSDDMINIERIIMDLPYSIDDENYNRLISIISLYRLTLGQARQEELIDYFEQSLKDFDNDSLSELFINLSPWKK